MYAFVFQSYCTWVWSVALLSWLRDFHGLYLWMKSFYVFLCGGYHPTFLHQSAGFLKFFLSGAAGGLLSLLIRNQSIYRAWWGCRSGEIVANCLSFYNFTEAKNVFVSFKNTDRWSKLLFKLIGRMSLGLGAWESRAGRACPHTQRGTSKRPSLDLQRSATWHVRAPAQYTSDPSSFREAVG